MRFTNSDHTMVEVDDRYCVYPPDNTSICYELLKDAEIEPYDKYYGLPLDEVKLRKKQEIKQERDKLLNGVTDVTTSQGTYPVDVNQTNRSNMHQAYDNAVLAGIDLSSTTVWKMGDNQHYTIRYSELAEIGLQLGIYISDLYQNEAVKNAQIDACTNRACVESVSWG